MTCAWRLVRATRLYGKARDSNETGGLEIPNIWASELLMKALARRRGSRSIDTWLQPGLFTAGPSGGQTQA